MTQPRFADAINGVPLIPIIQADDPADGVNIARAMAKGGITSVEVVLRTPKALDCVRAIRAEVDVQVGVGTLLTPEHIRQSIDAGAQFLVTPASSPTMLAALLGCGIPFIPGVGCTSDILKAWELGIREMKFFPAGLLGGAPMLKAIGSVFQDVSFCPTGGVSADNLLDFLSLKNVFAAGGSWLSPASAVAAKDWQVIENLCREAVTLIQSQHLEGKVA